MILVITKKILLLKAFTLIELLLVIALLGAMAAYGISFYSQKAQNERIDKAALEMQQIMQSAVLYHSDTGNWPNSSNSNGIFEENYILSNGKIPLNPWGNAYQYEQNPNNSGLFLISTHLPTSELAGQLAGHLPFAHVDVVPAGYQVTMEGDMAGSNNSYIIAAMNTTSPLSSGSNTVTEKFYCPGGWQAGMLISPYQMSVQKSNSAKRDDDSWQFGISSYVQQQPCAPDSQFKNEYDCVINPSYSGTSPNVKVTVSYNYIGYCFLPQSDSARR